MTLSNWASGAVLSDVRGLVPDIMNRRGLANADYTNIASRIKSTHNLAARMRKGRSIFCAVSKKGGKPRRHPRSRFPAIALFFLAPLIFIS